MLSCLAHAALSVLVLVVVLHILSSFFIPSAGESTTTEKVGGDAGPNGILLERSDSIDVVFIGDSEAYTSFSPLQMWDEHGFTSYVCATAGQQMPVSLSLLHRATASQHPRVVVIETNMLYRPTPIESALFQVFQDLFPLFEYHDRWKSLFNSSSEKEVAVAAPSSTKGYSNIADAKPADAKNYMAADDQAVPIPFRNEQYLILMIDYCMSIGATPVLVSTPSTVNWSTARHNGIATFAGEVNVDYVDLNVEPTKVAIDWAADTRDAGDHMNSSGAKKVSEFMGAYLSKAYGLADRRGDASYQAWNEAFADSMQSS